MGQEHRGLRGAMKGALRLLYPPQCLCCGAGVDHEGALCPDCWRETNFISGCACDRCGAPLPGETASDGMAMTCDDCMIMARPWDRGRAALVYGKTGRSVVLALKHGDRADLAPALSGWLYQAALPLIGPDTIVAPVPLHWQRLMRRKYNQAALLALGVADRASVPHLPGLLRRLRHTPGQDHRSVGDRFANIAGALAVDPALRARILGRPVLLIDDVMTSGATLAAASEALLAAGSGPVSVAVLARAVKDT